MCEIFPEIDKCCICCTLRVGLLFICILSICSGSLMLNITLKASKIDLAKSQGLTKDVNDYNTARKHSTTLALSIAIIMGFIFVGGGVILLFANLFDAEGYVQIFVWLVFLNVVLGMCGVLYMAGLCTVSTCALSQMDWLTASVVLIFIVIYLFWWVYFISVANSYVQLRTS